MNSPPLIELREMTKSFSGNAANNRVNLEIYRGEVHGLLGENGAGKSTLMKILYGFYRADSGEIRVNGRPVQIRSPHDARQFRIGMVFQDFILIPALTVAENIALFLPELPALLNRGLLIRQIRELCERYGLEVDPALPVWRLSVGERQKVEVLRLLLAKAEVLILDEPTRSLAPHEVEGLFRVFSNLRSEGYAVVFITHKLNEVMACADRITVMRKGRVADTIPGSEASEGKLVSLMFGPDRLELQRQRGQPPPDGIQPVLELRQVSTRAEGKGIGLREINLTILPGQMVGVAGVSGNGQKELGDVILGLEHCTQGTKIFCGREATHWSASRVRTSGVAFIPEEPLGMAAFAGLTVVENMVLGDTRRYSGWSGLSVDWARARNDLEASLNRLGFHVPPLGQAVGTLSGGNIQRIIFARETAHLPRLIVAFYPTRGLDVRSAVAARDHLLALREAGAGILLISEDLGELFSLSDLLVVLFRGRILASRTPREITLSEVGHLMTGSRGQGRTDE